MMRTLIIKKIALLAFLTPVTFFPFKLLGSFVHLSESKEKYVIIFGKVAFLHSVFITYPSLLIFFGYA